MVHLGILRGRKGWTQRQLAEHAGVSVRQIRRIEAGQVRPRWPTIAKLARALGVSEDEILAAVQEPVPMLSPASPPPSPEAKAKIRKRRKR